MAAEHAATDAAPAGAADFSEGVNPADTATSTAGSPPASSGGVWEAAALIGDQASGRVAELENEKKRLLAERGALEKEINKVECKRLRLKEKARGLSDADLLDIMATRATAKAKADAKAKAKAKAAA